METEVTAKQPHRRLMAELAYHDLEVGGAKNFHVVSHGRIFSSAQPNRQQFIEMEKHGCVSVLNLRSHHSDLPIISGLQIKEYRVATHHMTEDDVKAALEVLRDAPKPLLIHSCRGIDRTGLVVAAYRIVFENILPSEALSRYRDRANGLHRYLYRAFPRLIRKIDWEAMKKAILSGQPEEAAQKNVVPDGENACNE